MVQVITGAVTQAVVWLIAISFIAMVAMTAVLALVAIVMELAGGVEERCAK